MGGGRIYCEGGGGGLGFSEQQSILIVVGQVGCGFLVESLTCFVTRLLPSKVLNHFSGLESYLLNSLAMSGQM